ncbi:MAG: hypothetical protein M3Q71_23775 [Chloroflexota bacterium]|nr:hypothetical protein [Chloroflexota bacterium]
MIAHVVDIMGCHRRDQGEPSLSEAGPFAVDLRFGLPLPHQDHLFGAVGVETEPLAGFNLEIDNGRGSRPSRGIEGEAGPAEQGGVSLRRYLLHSQVVDVG